ncbi:M24 family metallopeptidase [Pyrococcus horikoshii]|uniref:Aminopeptidase P family protein n=2 Tax=Pyrococcus horikoshii TaxID=53953 RepID=A0A832W8M7_PYRHR|nr:Xaa-Pro peptidase family protein [Pyrococcus horikoshii]1WN1_A Chain A, dipeptidase [Pyrococcus horikoshii OT3]1WN1_B Chain B, dipeptidase [Pyrococcus horikoshii OT3]2HOW_A Chain A, 356aa long hypothetical dipeptidase [Pyrococcus horikoshii OT3]2HOW_B Chain B, 356aa long hypothetical dipeptidase [Pyrococcus horikoshii OT3]BAA30071.1 356aa long hypothetical dipeptidase [Pyrococcus horikoshii OT3]HII61968.1 aminopeptidase P family protein [Pyrococcus horikoshii]
MRLEKFIHLLGERGFDGALISPGTNLYYLTGLRLHEVGERLAILAVSAEGDYRFLAPSLYENVVNNFPATFWHDGENPYAKLREILEELGISKGRILIEDTMRADWLIGIMKLGKFTFQPLSSLIKELRMIKDKEEVKMMEHASRIADKVFEEILTWDLIGMKERELALKIELLIRELSDGIAFEPIVASGENAANPHHEPGERKIRKGDIIILDYGARWKGYCSDITRTIGLGELDERLVKIYEVVKDAQESAFKAVREGIKAKDVDSRAREVISKAGYGEYFIHRTGHGLGLDVHEEPYIGPDGEVILKNGMTFTIEPGIYVPGLGGVRIEDDIVVDEGKGRRLTKAERELIIL